MAKSTKPKGIEIYFSKIPDFAVPICERIREAILLSDSEIEESIKWSRPVYAKNSIICGFGAFKKHVSLMIFQGGQMKDPNNWFEPTKEGVMARSIKWNPGDLVEVKGLAQYIAEAIKIDQIGKKRPKKLIENIIPDNLKKAFVKEGVWLFFDTLAPSHKRDYLEWLSGPKRQETKDNRLAQAIEKLKNQETLHAKYQKK